ncbi:MAG: DUF3099 domain-containing protein [Actinomycetes bacterium]
MIPSKRTEAEPEVFSITGAHVPLSEDQSARTRRYLFSMALRTLCFIGAVLASGWLRWVLVAGAVFLPYISVVIANAGRESRRIPAPQTRMDDDARTLTS